MSEVPICQARANVMIYDDANKKWVPSGSSQGLSKVQIYQHTENNTFRVVGRKLQDHEVVINCAVLKNLKYNQATPTFHQWRDNRHVYGLNFANTADSETFANAMITALETLNNQVRHHVPPAPPNQPPMGQPHIMGQQSSMGPTPVGTSSMGPSQGPPMGYQPQNGPPYAEKADTRMSRPEYQGHVRYPSGGGSQNEARQVQPPQAPAAPPAPPAPPAAPSLPPAAPPSAPPAAPPAPPAPPAAPAAPPAPPAPGGAPGGGVPPPPPPPPVAASGNSESGGGSGAGGGGLAAALQAAKLKKTAKKEPTESKPPPGGNHMDELARKIARRAAINQQTNEDSDPRNVTPSPTPTRQSMDRNKIESEKVVTNGTGSPKFPRKRNPSLTGQENLPGASSGGVTASSTDLENMKQEILLEMRKEIQQVKQEILDAIRDLAR